MSTSAKPPDQPVDQIIAAALASSPFPNTRLHTLAHYADNLRRFCLAICGTDNTNPVAYLEGVLLAATDLHDAEQALNLPEHLRLTKTSR